MNRSTLAYLTQHATKRVVVLDVGKVRVVLSHQPSKRTLARLATILPSLYPSGGKVRLSRREVRSLTR